MKISSLRFFPRHAALVLALAAGLNFVTGCATRDAEVLQVSSIPAGARAQLSTGATGVTPVTFSIPHGGSLFLTVTKEGYEPARVELRPTKLNDRGKIEVANTTALTVLNPSALSRLVFFPLFLTLDLALDCSWDHQPNPVKLTLVPLRPATLAPDQPRDGAQAGDHTPPSGPPNVQVAANIPLSPHQP